MTALAPTRTGWRARPDAVRLAPVRSPAEWDELARRHGGMFFHRHAFLDLVAQALELDLDLRACELDGRQVGAVPLVRKRIGPASTLNWLPFPYVGPLVRPDVLRATLAALLPLERRMLCLRSQHVLTTHRPEPFHGYASADDRSFVVPVAGRSDEELLAAMHPDRRGSVRRARRSGIRIRPATREDVIRTLPELIEPTFAQQGLPAPYPRECFRLVWDRLDGHPDVLLQAAEADGDTIAVSIAFAGADTGLGWVVGRAPGKAGSDAFAAMVLETLGWSRDRGCLEFDLVGAPTEGIAAYKRGLGADERRYTVLRRQASVHRAAVALARRLPGSRVE